jgi:hypothetical protein
MLTIGTVGAVLALILDGVYNYVTESPPIVQWLATVIGNFTFGMVVLMEMDLLKTFCQLGKVLTVERVKLMQIGWIVFYIITNAGLFATITSINSLPSPTMQQFVIISVDIWIITCVCFDFCQTAYVIHVLLNNVKLLAENQAAHERELNLIGSKFSWSSDERARLSSLTKKAELDADQSSLAKRIIFSTASRFLLFVVMIVLMFFSQASYRKGGHYSLFGSACHELIFVLSALHLSVICYIFKLVQALCTKAATAAVTAALKKGASHV